MRGIDLHNKVWPFLVTLAGLLAVSGLGQAEEDEKPASRPVFSMAPEKRLGDAWPLDICAVCDDDLATTPSEPFNTLYNRREVRLCSVECAPDFVANSEAILEKADKKIIEQQKDDYPLDYCIVMPHMKLAGREDVDFYDVVANCLVVNCCEDCRKELDENPEKHLKALDAAIIEAQLPDYPLEACLVSGEKLGSMGEPINYVHANQLVRFCCAGCIETFEASPEKFMARLK